MVSKFEYENIEHTANDEECSSCWREYPKPCECGGLMHAHFGDYTGEEGDYFLETKCDKCGERDWS